MFSKKVLLWPVLISIVGHICLLSVSGVIDLRDNVKAAEIITVDLKETEPIIEPTKKEEEKEKKEVTKPKESKETKNVQAIGSGWREDTVDLSNVGTKYGAYLGKVKKKILEGWKYPPKAYERNEEGVVVIKISVDADGSVAQMLLLASSGSLLLDEGTLDVVRGIPSFDPLPDSYNLSRLNITVSFRYKLVE